MKPKRCSKAQLVDLSQRNCQMEAMDDPGLSSEMHYQALRGLARINRWSRTALKVHRLLLEMTASCVGQFRVLDVACGGGDVALALNQMGESGSLKFRVDGCDRSRRAVRFARQQARDRMVESSFFVCDLLREHVPKGYDFYISSLFLHHLSWKDASTLLAGLDEAAATGVIVSDLERGKAGYWMARMASRVLTRSPVVHLDGPLSVSAAFTVSEVEELAHSAGLRDFRLFRCWPFRVMLTWRKV